MAEEPRVPVQNIELGPAPTELEITVQGDGSVLLQSNGMLKNVRISSRAVRSTINLRFKRQTPVRSD